MASFSKANRILMQVEQQNGIPASEVLSAFFELIGEGVEIEEEFAVEMMDGLRQEERHYVARGGEGNARDLAKSYHRRMLIGVGMVENSTLPKEFILFSATLPAHEIADIACGVACESGRLFEIQELLAQYEWDDTLAEEERSCLEEEGEMILCRIFDTILTYVLQLYGHGDFVSFYEENKAVYHRRCENGRSLIISKENQGAKNLNVV